MNQLAYLSSLPFVQTGKKAQAETDMESINFPSWKMDGRKA
jgi:hypothetical protein